MRFANVSELTAEESDRRSAAAAAAIADAREAFIEWAEKALTDGAVHAAALDKPEYQVAAEQLNSVFHNLKGAGGGVGFDLLSSIGALGSDFVRALQKPSTGAARIAAAHLAAGKGVLAAGIQGAGGATGAALLEKLRIAQSQELQA